MKIGCTGHRNLDHDQTKIEEVFQWFLNSFKPELVITGMALGYDQLCAVSCLEMQVPFEAAVPFAKQQSKWPLVAQETYSTIISGASKITVVSTGEYAAWKMHARNAYIVNNSHVIVGYLNPKKHSGGTFQTMQMASLQKKPTYNIYEILEKKIDLNALNENLKNIRTK